MYDKLLFFKDGSNNIPHPHVLQHDPVALTLMQSLLLHPFQSRWTYGSSERTQSDPPPGTALNHPSRFYSLKTLALGKYFSCKPSYMTRWLLWDDCGEKPWRTTDPYGAREQRHQKCRQRSHHRSGSSRSSLCHMERNNDLDELFPNYWHVQSQAK